MYILARLTLKGDLWAYRNEYVYGDPILVVVYIHIVHCYCFYYYSLNTVCERWFCINTSKSKKMVFETLWKSVIVLLPDYICHLSLSLYNPQ